MVEADSNEAHSRTNDDPWTTEPVSLLVYPRFWTSVVVAVFFRSPLRALALPSLALIPLKNP